MSAQSKAHFRIEFPLWVTAVTILWANVYAALINSGLINDNQADPAIQPSSKSPDGCLSTRA